MLTSSKYSTILNLCPHSLPVFLFEIVNTIKPSTHLLASWTILLTLGRQASYHCSCKVFPQTDPTVSGIVKNLGSSIQLGNDSFASPIISLNLTYLRFAPFITINAVVHSFVTFAFFTHADFADFEQLSDCSQPPGLP